MAVSREFLAIFSWIEPWVRFRKKCRKISWHCHFKALTKESFKLGNYINLWKPANLVKYCTYVQYKIIFNYLDLRAWIERCCYPLLSPTWSQRWYPIGGKYYYQRQQNIFINIIIILVNSNMNSIRQMLTKSKLLFLPVNIIEIFVILTSKIGTKQRRPFWDQYSACAVTGCYPEST